MVDKKHNNFYTKNVKLKNETHAKIKEQAKNKKQSIYSYVDKILTKNKLKNIMLTLGCVGTLTGIITIPILATQKQKVKINYKNKIINLTTLSKNFNNKELLQLENSVNELLFIYKNTNKHELLKNINKDLKLYKNTQESEKFKQGIIRNINEKIKLFNKGINNA